MSYPRIKRNKVKDKSLINTVKNFMWCYNSFSLIVFYIYIKYNFSVLKFFAFCLYNSTTGRPQHHSKQKNKVPKEHKTKNDCRTRGAVIFFSFIIMYNIIIQYYNINSFYYHSTDFYFINKILFHTDIIHVCI